MKEVEKLEDAEEILEVTNPYVERGKAIGRKEERLAVAREMLKKGLSIKLIAEVTKLSKKQIEQLKND